ncbi:hypothetical protein FA95DRAFT_532351 [Auriscalpium vulgare]|uniref:Uncharacterized protein n=1 Tax=Auriscalpium vulgare TaxID=40419 RepID=A0ACB8RFA5_9AGAM|nr:hypothetical protein FA95DRAFT_532351 [Auriscalpium vulgare]
MTPRRDGWPDGQMDGSGELACARIRMSRVMPPARTLDSGGRGARPDPPCSARASGRWVRCAGARSRAAMRMQCAQLQLRLQIDDDTHSLDGSARADVRAFPGVQRVRGCDGVPDAAGARRGGVWRARARASGRRDISISYRHCEVRRGASGCVQSSASAWSESGRASRVLRDERAQRAGRAGAMGGAA